MRSIEQDVCITHDLVTGAVGVHSSLGSCHHSSQNLSFMSIHIEAAFVPIVLNLVANIQAANPDRDLSVLIACLEDCGCYSIERLESGRRDLWCPPSKKLYPCLNFVLDILADRVIAQPEVSLM